MANNAIFMNTKPEIVGVCTRCGHGVYTDDEVCRICEGCGKLTVWCECKEIPLEKVKIRGKMVEVFAGPNQKFASKISKIDVYMYKELKVSGFVINILM